MTNWSTLNTFEDWAGKLDELLEAGNQALLNDDVNKQIEVQKTLRAFRKESPNENLSHIAVAVARPRRLPGAGLRSEKRVAGTDGSAEGRVRRKRQDGARGRCRCVRRAYVGRR